MKIKALILLSIFPASLLAEDQMQFLPGQAGFAGQSLSDAQEDMFMQGPEAGAMFGPPPGVDQEEFYSEVANQMREAFGTEEGFEEINRAAGEMVRELASDPKVIEQNPELGQIRDALEQDPGALRDYMRDFRDVMTDPNAAKEVLQTFEKFAEDQDSPEPEKAPELPVEEPAAEKKISRPEKKYEPPKRETIQLSKVEIKGDWRDVLLDRKAEPQARAQALHRMVRDFDKAYKNLYWIKNARDIESEHLGEKARRRIEAFVDAPGGLSDYAAAVWTATSDGQAAKFFLDRFSGMGTFLEELVDFDESVKELAKVAKLASKGRQKVDRQFEEGIIPPVMTGQEKEVEMRVKGSQNMGSRLSEKLEKEFLKEPKLADVFKQKKAQASGGGSSPKDSSKKDYGSGGYGSGGHPGGGQGYGGGQQGGGYYSPYGPGYHDQQRDRGFASDDPAEKSSGSLKKPKAKKLTDDQQSGHELFKALTLVGRSLPDKDQEFFAKVEAVYNLMEASPGAIDGLIEPIGKVKTTEKAGGLMLKAEPEGDDEEEVKGAANLVFKKSDLALAAAGVVKANVMLTTEFAFDLNQDTKKLNGGAKTLSQPPRPHFYMEGKKTGHKDESKGGFFQDFSLEKTPKQLEVAVQSLAKNLIGQKQFVANRREDIKKLVQGFSSKGVAPPAGAEAELRKSFANLRMAFESQIEEPGSTQHKMMFFNLDKQITVDAFLGGTDGQEMLNSFSKNLTNMLQFALSHRIVAPFPGVKALEKKVHKVLAVYEEFLDKACNQNYDGSFSAKLKYAQETKQNPSKEFIEFLKGYGIPEKHMESTGAAFKHFKDLHQRACALWSFQDCDFSLGIVGLEQTAQQGEAGRGQDQESPDQEGQMPEGMGGGQGGWLSMIMGHPVTQWVMAGLGMLGIWKITEFIKSWWTSKSSPKTPVEKPQPQFIVVPEPSGSPS